MAKIPRTRFLHLLRRQWRFRQRLGLTSTAER